MINQRVRGWGLGGGEGFEAPNYNFFFVFFSF